MRERAAFCHFYGYTSGQVRELTAAEYVAFREYMIEVNQRGERAN